MSKTEVINGFVICQPLTFMPNKWHVHHSTFSPTAFGAWDNWLGHNVPEIDKGTKIQHWFNRGFRIAEAQMTVKLPSG